MPRAVRPYRRSSHRQQLLALLPRIVVLLLITTALILLAHLLVACERRDLYVYGDEFHNMELVVDWRDYSDTDPEGMTFWFYSLDDPTRAPYTMTTPTVRFQHLYMAGGRYDGVVIDYSPQEFARQHFFGLDREATARVESAPLAYQPSAVTVAGEGVPAGTGDAVNVVLFGENAWNGRHAERPALQANGLYTVASQPEQMALDTLRERVVSNGEYGDYIPWEHRNTYQSTLTVDTIYSVPHPIIWSLRVRVYITKGFNSLWTTVGSVAGLSDGHFLASDTNIDRPCLLMADSWQQQRTGPNSGYVTCTLTTFGLRPSGVRSDRELHTTRSGEVEPAYPPANWNDYYTGVCLPEELRLNLSFVLRDHATVVNYHFNVGERVVSYDHQRVLRVELGPDWPEPIELPYVEPYSGAGFDANVEDWKDGGTRETTL